jgi:hypothetical protein
LEAGTRHRVDDRNDFGPVADELERLTAPDTTPGAGDDGALSVEQTHRV